MVYAISILAFLIVAVLLLRLRVHFQLAPHKNLLFVGLGRTGSEMNLRTRTGAVRLFGWQVGTFSLSRKEKPLAPAKTGVGKAGPKTKGARRVRSTAEVVAVFRQCARPSWRYIVALVKSSKLEELDGNVTGGFESPDLTGQAYGCYQALTATVPALAGRFTYVPDWNGASFAGALRVSVALPLYMLIFHSLSYILRLPLRKIVKLAIGTKEGDRDVK